MALSWEFKDVLQCLTLDLRPAEQTLQMLISSCCLSIIGVTQPFSGDRSQDRTSQFFSLWSGLCLCQLQCRTLHSFTNRHAIPRNQCTELHFGF